MIPNARRVLVLLWGLGVDLCSLDAAFVLATVSNRRKHDCVGTLWPCLRGVVTFGGLKRRAASFRVGGMALCDILTCLSQVVFLTSAMLLQGFQKMSSMFPGRRISLETSIFCLRGGCIT